MSERCQNKVVRMTAICVSLISVLLLVSNCVNRNDASSVATEFVYALVNADRDRAEAVTTEDLWDRISEWMEGREPMPCRGAALMDPSLGGSGLYIESENEWNYGFYYQCPSQETPYCLDVNDIRLKWTQNGWQIYDFGSICEAHDYGGDCRDTCR